MSVERIDRYEILAEIGHGGMSTVYHARDPEGEEVAIKVLRREYLTDLGFRARFERETQTIATLEHPAIVPLLSFGRHEEQLFLVMPYMPGGSLNQRLLQGALSPQAAGAILTSIASALDTAHARGVIHGDLKPSNILLDADGQAYLADFGIALQMTAGAANHAIVGGTPAYMSPEQCRPGEEVDGRSDIYSLGVTLFQMLTGRLPFDGDTPLAILAQHMLQSPPDPHALNPDLPAAFGPLIIRALAKEPSARYQTAGELSTAYQRTLADPSAESSAEGDSSGRIAISVVEGPAAEIHPTDSKAQDDDVHPGHLLKARALLMANDTRRWLVRHFAVAMALVSLLGAFCAVTAVMAIRGPAMLQSWSARAIASPPPPGIVLLPIIGVEVMAESNTTESNTAPTPAVVPDGTLVPNLLLLYTGERVTAVNISIENLSLKGVVFYRPEAEGTSAAAFAADEWGGVAGRAVAALPPGDCLQLLHLDGPSSSPQAPLACDRIQGWLATRRVERLFFLPAAGVSVFEVSRGEQLISRCTIGDGECRLHIPQP